MRKPRKHKKNGPEGGTKRSLAHLDRALKTIPGGTQTFSKSYLHHIRGISPFFIDRGKGAYVWDVDGNKYIDYLAALLPVLLGYCDNDVDEAIKTQLAKGISFSLATDLEAELAEILVDMIPSAEMVRFSKSGSDVTAGAIRVARAHTGRTQIATCGYHGWHDWYIGSTPSGHGVPEETKKLIDRFEFNDIESLKLLLSKNEYAAIILEAEAVEKSRDGFLEDVRAFATKQGAVLIFDEIVSGFRSSYGGIQELRNVEPDLSCFGKAMGNGMPISALVGKGEFMRTVDSVFFSGTFGGETLSLAAAIACLRKYKNTDGVAHINTVGATLQKEINAITSSQGIGNILQVGGESWWPNIAVQHEDAATVRMLVRQELARNGIIQGSSFNITAAHCDDTLLEQTIAAWQKVAVTLSGYLNDKDIVQYLDNGPATPLFQVRR